MKRILIYIIPLAILMGFLACNKEEDKGISTVNLNFDFVYGSENFEANKVYNYSLGYAVKFEKLQVYISKVRLTDKEGTVIEGPEILFVDAFSTSNGISFEIPGGDYSKIEFSIGVPPNLNGTDNPDFDAALYNSKHALSLTNGMYWTWNSGYRFILMDGRMNSDPMVDDIFETLVSIHTGKDYSFRTVNLGSQFNAPKDQTVGITLTFDVADFLDNEDDVIDLAVDNQTHGENAALANRVSDNAMKAVKASVK